MAVRKVWGICDGAEIQFERNAAGQWTAAVLADPDNSYVVELWAEDDAGNVGYYATVLFTFNPIALEYSFVFLGIDQKACLADYGLHAKPTDVEMEASFEDYDFHKESDYELSVLAFSERGT